MSRAWIMGSLLAALSLPAMASPGSPLATAAYAQVTIEADTDRKQVRVGETLRLKVVVVQQAAVQGAAETGVPALPPLPGFTVYGQSSSTQVTMVQNVLQARSVQEYALRADAPGRHTIPPVTYSYVDPQTRQPLQLQSRPIEVQVLAAGGGGAASLLWLTGLGLMTAGGAAALVASRRRPRPPAPAEGLPDAPAEPQDIRRLRFLMDSQQEQVFYGAVSDLIRAEVAHAYDIPAQTQTSGELLATLRELQIREPVVELARRVLERCDLARFAGYSSGPQEMERTFQELYDLIEAIAKG